jgi:arylsulfatase A-like enzyme
MIRLIAILAVIAALLSMADVSHAQNKPNIVYIMADDMGYGDTTVYNPKSKIPTPNMDALAAQGIVFTDAHSPSSVCTPTRYGVLTGRYSWRTRLKRGVFGGFNRPLIEPGRMTVPSLLKEHGYATACIGKWHLGMDWTLKEGVVEQEGETVDVSKPIRRGPLDHGFDYYFVTPGCTTDDPPYCFVENNRILGDPVVTSPGDDPERRLLMAPGWRHEDADIAFANKAVGFIKKHVATNPDQPFFLYLPVSVPHIPWLPPESVKGRSEAGARGDQVVLADVILGQVMETLDTLGMAGNTLLIFTSDNGPREGVHSHSPAGDLRGLKGMIWEGGHRVPFIARWPGHIQPGTKSDALTTLTDLLATTSAIVGAELPDDAGEDSFNMLPALLGEELNTPIRDSAIHHSGSGAFALRQGDWKLIVGTKGDGYINDLPREDAPGQLYNLGDDPHETHDLWDTHPEMVERLHAVLDGYRDKGSSRAF